MVTKFFHQKIEEVNAAANVYGKSITGLVSQLTNSMIQDDNPGAHIETLKIVKQTLTQPSLENISLCEQQAEKISEYEYPNSVFNMGKIISGTLLCLAGALTIALAVTLTIASTAITMGASAPLSLPAGIGIGVAGLGLIVAGSGLIASGILENRSSVFATFKNLLGYPLNELLIQNDLNLQENQNPSQNINGLKQFLRQEFSNKGGISCLRFFTPRHIEKMLDADNFTEIRAYADEALQSCSFFRLGCVEKLYEMIARSIQAQDVVTNYHLG
ncbi:MAG: hypothetical protein H0U73_07875 [Tatlockia sp.]|nr:hypothetical protein [Tatlockia sp.]